MVEPATSRFWHAAEQSGLLTAAQLAACWAEIPPERRTVDAIDRRLARRAIDAGLLTTWQAQQLLAGRSGFQFGRYLLLNLVGEGGMGRVYLARDTRLNRKVALKVLSRERMNNPRAVTRFRREARVGAQLQHENLVRIYDEGEEHGLHFLVMEYIEGTTVGRLLHERGPLPARIAARVGRQVALGLEHAQQKGMIHRDVNPMNILIDREGNAKLTDLGLAIDLADQEAMVTRDGATVGTFDYIAPEQARHSRSVDTRADLYSLGCTLYHMIAGRVPFPQPSLPEKLYGHQALEPERLSSLVAGVPEEIEAIVRKLMAKAPEDRYQRPDEVARALEPFQAGPMNLDQIEAAAVPRPAAEEDEEPVVLDDDRRPGVGAGSDAELVRVAAPAKGVARPAPAPAAAPAATSAPAIAVEPVKPGVAVAEAPILSSIDFGPVAPLSDSLSGDRRTVKPIVDGVNPRRLWLAAGVGLAALTLLALGLLRPWEFGAEEAKLPPGPTRPAEVGGQGQKPQPGAAAAGSAMTRIAIRWKDGSPPEPLSDLHDAIRRAEGRAAEVVLGDGKPIALDSSRPIIVFGGPLVIRAADGAQPIIRVTLKGNNPAIRTPGSGALRMSGLTFTADTGGQPATAAALIQAGGDLELDRCAFSTGGADLGALHAVSIEGKHATFNGCQFDGFREPIGVEAYPDSVVKLTQCLATRGRAGEGPTGWAIRIRIKGAERPPGPALTIDHCTVAGLGLLAAGGFTAATPLRVDIHNTLVAGPALLTWVEGSEEPTAALKWSGRRDRYAIDGPAWLLGGADGNAPRPGAPTDLEGWASAIGGEDASRGGPVAFGGDPTTPGPITPAEFVPTSADDHLYGIDPARVGPRRP